jgi:hypothetical protein
MKIFSAHVPPGFALWSLAPGVTISSFKFSHSFRFFPLLEQIDEASASSAAFQSPAETGFIRATSHQLIGQSNVFADYKIIFNKTVSVPGSRARRWIPGLQLRGIC